SAQIREILINESAWEEMTCLFAPSLAVLLLSGTRCTPVDETVLELDSFPIKLGFEEVGFNPLCT
ncbi:hypothetical protein ACNIS8_27590, partial [Escherichia coli]